MWGAPEQKATASQTHIFWEESRSLERPENRSDFISFGALRNCTPCLEICGEPLI